MSIMGMANYYNQSAVDSLGKAGGLADARVTARDQLKAAQQQSRMSSGMTVAGAVAKKAIPLAVKYLGSLGNTAPAFQYTDPQSSGLTNTQSGLGVPAAPFPVQSAPAIGPLASSGVNSQVATQALGTAGEQIGQQVAVNAGEQVGQQVAEKAGEQLTQQAAQESGSTAAQSASSYIPYVGAAYSAYQSSEKGFSDLNSGNNTEAAVHFSGSDIGGGAAAGGMVGGMFFGPVGALVGSAVGALAGWAAEELA